MFVCLLCTVLFDIVTDWKWRRRWWCCCCCLPLSLSPLPLSSSSPLHHFTRHRTARTCVSCEWILQHGNGISAGPNPNPLRPPSKWTYAKQQ